MKSRRPVLTGNVLIFLLVIICFLVLGRFHSGTARSVQTSTWSIVAVDPASGDVGVAGATCLPFFYVDGLAALVPGKGAAATQAQWDLENRNRVFQLLKEGLLAEEVLRQVTNRANDPAVDTRQYGIVTLADGEVNVATFTGTRNQAWAGAQQAIENAVTVQGNILVGKDVVDRAMEAFKSVQTPGRNTLADRLMRALEAGSAAGGDTRCNSDEVQQTAASAFILVARGTDDPYASRDLGITDAGTSKAPWLALSVTGPRFGVNPLIELRRQYDRRREQ